MLSVSYAGKNAYSAGKTSGVLMGGASGANRCFVLAPCAPPPLGPNGKNPKKLGEKKNMGNKIWASTYPLLAPEAPPLKTPLVLPALYAFLPA